MPSHNKCVLGHAHCACSDHAHLRACAVHPDLYFCGSRRALSVEHRKGSLGDLEFEPPYGCRSFLNCDIWSREDGD